MTVSPTPPVGAARRGTRRRGETLRRAIFDATLEQLRSVGYLGLTMDGIAAAAGTGKAALYRRWANKEDLVIDALRSSMPDPAQVRLTGVPREDILALLRCMRETANIGQDAAFQVAKKEGGMESGLSALVQERVMIPCRDKIREVLDRGAREGTLHPAADHRQIAEIGPAMLVNYAMTKGPMVPDSYLVSVVDNVILPLASVLPANSSAGGNSVQHESAVGGEQDAGRELRAHEVEE